MKVLSIDDIKKANDIKTAQIEVPEWGGIITIRGLTGEEFDKIQKDSYIENDKKEMVFDNFRNELLTIINGILTPELSMSDALWLKQKSYVALRRVLFAIQDLSAGLPVGLSEKKEKEEAKVDNANDNSGSNAPASKS